MKGLPLEARGGGGEFTFPEALLVDIGTGRPNESLIASLIDSETGLFDYAFLNYKLDEEFKRARRFDHPLACVMLGFEGRAREGTLRELAGIFLESSRDTDVLGRFDENTFLFLLPNTGPDGASIMAERVSELAEERGLSDLVGDPIQISVGTTYPHPKSSAQRAYVARDGVEAHALGRRRRSPG
jgi:GGDEF domain-containing protein